MKRILVALICAIPVAVHSQDRGVELTYLRTVVPTNLLDVAKIEVAARENLAAIQDGDGSFLRLQMFANQRSVNKGNRAEISIDYPFMSGDTVAYAWRFRIPTHSNTDAPTNRWWVMAQWHDQPDVRLGETWDRFPEKSPPVALGYGVVDGRDVVSLSYGAPEQSSIAYTSIERGVWHEVAAVIRWSTDSSGSATVSLNGEVFAVAFGRNMHNNNQHYLKIGTYRHRDIQVASQIDIDDLTISNAAE